MKIREAKLDEVRFRFVSDYVTQTINRLDPVHKGLLKESLQTNLQRISDRKYHPAISSLRRVILETQAAAAYLLLAEACAQTGQTETALAILDVLSCIDPDRAESEMMKEFFRQEAGDGAGTPDVFQSEVQSRIFCVSRRETKSAGGVRPRR